MAQTEIAISLAEFRRRYNAAKKNTSLASSLGKALLAPIEAKIASVPAIECRAGCAHCCVVRVEAFPFEVVAIYFKLVNSLKPAELEEFKARLRERFESIRNMSVDERLKTNVQCPMLQNSRCMVYEVRPVACGGHHSLAVANCIDSYEHPEITDVNEAAIPVVASVKKEQELRNGVAYTVLEQEGDDTNHYELVRSLWELFQDPKLIQRWKDGRRIFNPPG